MEAFVLDACSLIAFLNDEEGAGKVEDLLRKAKAEKVNLYMNKLNILEAYYGVYRDDGEEAADETLSKILELPIVIVDDLSDGVLLRRA
jgi:PIN domain nuclease of toxin-antitoxin system